MATLLGPAAGEAYPLPPELASVYGRLAFPAHPGRPYVVGNFVSTLDGVVSLGIPGHAGGGEISGFNMHDRLVMGLLRAAADAVVVGAGTLRAVGRHLWTAEHAYPPLAHAYQGLRAALGKTEPPLNVIVTARGQLDLSLPVFKGGAVPVLIATTAAGAWRLAAQTIPPAVQVVVLADEERISVQAILEAVGRERPLDVLLTEGGPQMMSDFMAEAQLDELFLTLSPQVAGRGLDGNDCLARPALVMGRHFAPEHPLWGRLADVRQAESHLFLRYVFERGMSAEDGRGE